jgi:lipopolysaccharide biosynthesis glycosyltransferase
MKNLVYIASHNNQHLTLPHGIRSWELYCEKYGIDLVISNKTIESSYKVGAFCAYEKWNEDYIIYSDYDKILIVDTDTIVRWDAPNIFNTFPDINFGMVSDAGSPWTGYHHYNQWTTYCDLTSVDFNDYCNSGVALLSLGNYKKIHTLIKDYFEFWKYTHENTNNIVDGIDQTPVNIIGKKDCGGVSILPDHWNNMVMSKYDSLDFINDSYVWHFTGPRLGGWKNKSYIMETVWNLVKDFYVHK